MKKFDAFRTVLLTLLLLVGLTTVGWGQTPVTVFSENFDGFYHNSLRSPGSASRDAELNNYTQQPGWIGSKIYEAGGAIKLASSSSLGWIQTPSINLSANNGAFTLRFKAMAWSGDSTKIKVYIINANDTTIQIVTGLSNDTSYTFSQFELNLTGGTASTMIKFAGNQPAKGRYFIENLEILQTIPTLAIVTPSEGQTFLTTESFIGNMIIQNFNPGVDGYLKIDAAFLYPIIGATTMYCGPAELAMLSSFPFQLPAGNYSITATLVGMDSVAITPAVSVTRNFSFIVPPPTLAIVSPIEGQIFAVTDTLRANVTFENFVPGVDGLLKLDAAFLYYFIGATTMYCGPAELAFLSTIPIQLPAGNYSITASLVGMDSVAITPAVSVTRNFSFISVNDPSILPASGFYYYPQTVSMNCETPGAEIRYTLDGSTPTDTSLLYTAPFTVSQNTTVNAIAFTSASVYSNMVTATYTFPVEVANIREFKAANTTPTTTVYKITGDVTFVYRDNRNIFVQDTTGGLLVFDFNTPVVTRQYVEGDVITGGICGTYSLYNGLSEMIPAADFPASTVNSGAVLPIVTTVTDLNDNYATYETRLVKLTGTTFNTPGYTFTGNANTNITQGTSQMVFRNHFGNLTNVFTTPAEKQSITGFLITYNTTRQIAPRATTDIVPDPIALPVNVDFETPTFNANWTLVNGTVSNKWYIGQAQGFDNNKLYISSSNGITNKYNANENLINVVHAYRDIEVSELGGLLSFDYRVMGEICSPQCDYLQVSLLPVNTQLVAGTIPSSYLVQLNGTNDWSTYSSVLPAGTYRLVFTWVNDQYSGEQYPAAVDNIVINPATCATPSNLAATIDATLGVVSANISWTISGTQNAWLLEYKLTNHTEWYSVNVTGSPLATLTNLQPNSTYDFRVKALCEGENSQYAISTFVTPCVNSIVSSLPYRVGTGSSLIGTIPTNTYYKYSYSQIIFLASELAASGIPAAPATINAIAYRYNYSTAQPRIIDIYMVNTTNSTFASTATTSWMPVTSGDLVYSGTVNFSGTGTDNWVIINLTTPFQYTGNNIMIAMDDNTGTNGTSASKFYYHASPGTNVSLYYYNSTTNPNPLAITNAATSRSSNNNDIKFYANTVVCVDTIACPLPTNLAVNNITAYTADISWTAGSDETSWGVEYKLADATDWTVINSSSNSITLTGLQRISNYVVRVKAICGNNDNSLYTSPVAFTTLATCPTPANFTYNNAANMTTITWDADNQTEWISQIKQASQDDNAWTTINIYNLPSATISGLVPNTLYNFRVKAICSEEDQSAWGIFNFTSGCLPFSIPFEENFASTSLPACWTNVNNAWTFSSGTARSTSLTPNNFIITPAILLPASGNIAINYDIATSIATDEHYDVMISFRGTNPENFISLYDETINNTTLTNRVVSIPAEYYGGNVYIAFVHNSAASSATLILDNVVVSACASAPTQLTASNITATSADLSWTVDASATQWIFEYSLDQSVWNTMNVSTNPYTLTGLTGSTNYYVRVKTICSDGFESVYSNVVNFTTLCPQYNIPFLEDFETTSTTLGCWTVINNNNDGDTWMINTSSSYVYSGSRSMQIYTDYNSGNNNDYLITPNIILTGNQFLSFYQRARSSGEPNDYKVLLSTTGNNPADFTTVLYSDTSSNTTFEKVKIDLRAYTGPVYIAFYIPQGGLDGYYFYIDYVSVENYPPCPEPINLALSYVTENSANFSWTANGSETQWTVEYKLASESTWTVVNNVTATHYTISNLNGSTQYSINFRVKAVCSEIEQSIYTEGLFNFATPCPAVSVLPLLEGFESNVMPPACWTAISTNTANPLSIVTTPTHNGSGYSFRFNSYNSATTYDQYLISPELILNNPIYLKFYYSTFGYNEVFAVGYSTTTNDISSFIYETPVTSSTTSWVEYMTTIPANTKYISIHYYSNYMYYLYIDDVKLEAIPTCFNPTALTASNITNNSADISWTAGGSETQWTLEYKLSSASTWTTVTNINANTYSLSNLLSSTSYDVRIKAVCSISDESPWSNTFTFFSGCDVYTNFPFTESFEAISFPPLCWTVAHTQGTDTRTWLRSTSYYHTGVASAQLQDQYDGNKNNLVTPQLNIPTANTHKISFWIYRNTTGTSYPEEGVKVWTNSTPDTVGGTPLIYIRRSISIPPTQTTTGWYEYSVFIPNAGLQYVIFEGISDYGNATYIDDININIIPTCLKPTALVASNISTTSADLSWTAGGTESQWTLEYKLSNASTWTTISNITTNSYTLNSILASNSYDVRVKAVCSTTDESSWSDIYTFVTDCDVVTTFPFTESFDGTVFPPLCWTKAHTAGSSTSTWTRSTSYVHTGVAAAQLPDQQLGNKNNLVTPQFNIPNASSYEVTFWIYRSSYSSLKPNEGVKVWANSTPDTVGGTPLIQIRRDYLAQPVVSSVGWYKYSAVIPNAGLQYIIFEGISEYGTATYMDDIMVSLRPEKEMKVVATNKIYDACDLSNIPISMTVSNNGLLPVTEFTANYQINAGTVVTEQVTLATPLLTDQEFTYTFNTLANFVDPSNTINVWIDYADDIDVSNNSLTVSGIDLVSPIAVPYNENFTSVVLDQNGWRVYDVNDDEVIWTKTSGKLQYAYNDALAANDWVMTPCINIPAGKYEIAYSYNALSVMPESFSVYMGLGPSVADMTTLVASHPSVVKTASDIIFRDTITLTTDGIYYFGFNATSLPGNLGLTVDNFSITPMIDLNVTYGPNGKIDPNGLVTVPLNSTATFGISPNPGFHIKGIFVDDVMVRGEDMQNSRFEFFNYGPVQQAANIHVTFEVSQYNVVASASNYMGIDYFGDGTIAGTIAPMDTTVVEFGFTQDYIMTPAEHYHLYSFLVDGQESIGNVTDLGNGTFKYNTGRVYAHHTLEAIFKLDTVAIIYNIHSGQGTADGMYADATVTSPVVRYTYVDYNSDHLSTILSAPGYRTESVTVNGTPLAGIVDYQFVDVIAPQIVDINFVLDSYTITTAAYGNGTITPGTTVIYDPAYTYTYDVTPATGYHISSILVNGQPITVPDPTHYSATLTDIHQDYLIEAFFEINTYTIEAIAGTHGSINPNGTTTYNWGTTAVYNVIADLGYYISAVTVDGVTTNYTQANNMTTWSTTFANIQGNHTVNVAFAQYTYTISATASANGTITPSGVTTLPYGGSQLYTIAPATGYEIVAVTVDGINMGVITQYTFADVTANHTIAVTFAPLQYTIDAIASVGGSITPSGTAVYNYGASVTYNATANTGYTISTVTVDGVVTTVNAATWSHAFNNITEDHAIYVAFEINTYTITVNQAANGAITPGTQTVNYGTTPSFYITPNVGYAVSSVLVDGSTVSFTTDLAGVATYTFPAIAANHSITATFAVKTLTIVASTIGNGTITPAGTTTLNYGASQTYNIAPAIGYQITDVVVDNMSIGAVTTYQFSNVTVNHTIAAHFALIACETPSYLYATEIGENSAKLNWSNTGADSYTVRYKTLDTADYTEIAGITSNYYVLNDLTDNTYYVWTVKAVCDYNESDWAVQSSFTTLETPIIGIHEAALSTVKVYSNLNNVYIVNNNQVAIKQVEIFDMFGRVIYVGTAANNPEVISLMVANGTYVVRLATTEGVATYKVNITR